MPGIYIFIGNLVTIASVTCSEYLKYIFHPTPTPTVSQIAMRLRINNLIFLRILMNFHFFGLNFKTFLSRYIPRNSTDAQKSPHHLFAGPQPLPERCSGICTVPDDCLWYRSDLGLFAG